MVNFVNSAILFVEFPQVQYMELCQMGCVHNKSFFVVRYILRAKTLQFPLILNGGLSPVLLNRDLPSKEVSKGEIPQCLAIVFLTLHTFYPWLFISCGRQQS